MISSSSSFRGSGTRNHTYSRKQKSLGLLCSNFLSLYNRDDVDSVGLDEAASRLGVERRRIYDIVNVLESVGVLARKAKNQYSWKGFGAMPLALEELKEEALRESLCNGPANLLHGAEVLEGEGEKLFHQRGESREDILSPSSVLLKDSTSSSLSSNSKADNRREKSLGLLTRNFVKLFLSASADMISLDEAARSLLGDFHNSFQMRNNSAAKVRRLYDIANVLSSMNLIEKTHETETRKPAFRWLGMNGKSNHTISSSKFPNPKQSNKREFGTEITNIDFKRSKVFSVDEKPKKMQTKCEIKNGHNQMQQQQRQGSKDYVYGPFCPVSLLDAGDSERGMKRAQDWEALASSFPPRYHNQALSELFSHYMEAWKSWYIEVAKEN